ncbi:MAG TPA: hypothetical protein VM695_00440 [Phycisphaerae bacterium]|nr:hypothetical protein [Phycisphaerae bacterium]
MDETLDKRLGSIVTAGWQAALVAACAFVPAWLFYVAIMQARPAWLLGLWGGSLDWPTVQVIGMCLFGAMKVLWIVFLFCLLFLALLRRQLRQTG